jgi:phospholipid/cholesterol/gamma-HCH transport system substrate-binding protein
MPSTMGRIYRATHLKIYGVLFIGLLVLAMYVIVALYNQWWTGKTMVHLQTPRVGNQLNLGGDVKMRGAFVGTIQSIHVNSQDVTVDIALKPKYVEQIPENVQARILPKTIFGEKYIDLVVPEGSTVTAPIKAGADIKIDDSKVAIETDQVFDDLLPLLQKLQPVKLNQTLNAMATALQERGNALGENFSITDKYFTGLNPNMATINHDISGLADLAESYGNAAPDLLRLAKDSAISLQEVVVPKQDQLLKFFTGTKDFANTTNRVLTENENNFIALAANSRPILDVMATYSTEFPCLLRGLTDIQTRLEGTFANGPFLYVHLETMKKPESRLYVDPADNPQTPGSDLYNYQNYSKSPSCNGLPYPNQTANYPHPGVSAATVAANDAAVRASAYGDIGPVGSPYENDLVSVIAAPLLNVAPHDVPGMADLLLGPLMRGTAVSLG